MKATSERYDLRLRHAFTISRSSRDAVPVVLLTLRDGDITAYGEASPNSRYGETVDSVAAFLSRVDLSRVAAAPEGYGVAKYLDTLSSHDPSAKAAMDIAVHDLMAKRAGIPLYKFLGLEYAGPAVSSFTIGIDSPEIVREKVIEAGGYPVLKIKVGLSNDLEIINAVRGVTGKPLRVDANEGWKTKEEALEKINWLTTQNVELIEQPMPASQIEDIRWLRERVSIPIIADEALDSPERLKDIAKAYDGVNVKVQKIGGLYKSKNLIEEVHRLGLKVMIGCMIESSIGITAAAHLASLADWLDLDGNVLISNDPFAGAENRNGEIFLNDKPGLGVTPAG
jgi:L-Ala-D/L-Glu epimerase / N-acetyl-D-glutamate racemase